MATRTHTICLALSLVGTLFAGGCKDDDIPPGDDLSNPQIIPRVVFTLPAPGSVGPYKLYAPGPVYGTLPHFVVRFNKLIRKSSIQPRSVRAHGFRRPVFVSLAEVTYYPLRSDKAGRPMAIGSTEREYFDDLLAFRISDSVDNRGPLAYDVGQAITITLDSTIEDINGNHLTPYGFSYLPEPLFRVTASSPEDGSIDIASRLSSLELYFNTRVDGDIFSHVRIQPAIFGTWSVYYYDSALVSLSIPAPLEFAVPYTLVVDASAHDILGNTIGTPDTLRFTTVPFGVSSFVPSASPVWLTQSVMVIFTGLVDSGTVRTSFSISPQTSGAFHMYSPMQQFTFVPAIGLAPNTSYTVTVGTNLRAWNGQPLASPFSRTFTTDSFRIASTSPRSGSVNVSRSAGITVRFNAPIAATNTPGILLIYPETTGSWSMVEGGGGQSGEIRFSPSPPFTASTTYTVTVTPLVMTKTGYPLPQPYSFSFTTGN